MWPIEKAYGALTMRRLGAELGVEAMALYKHVSSKDDMLDGMVELVVSRIEAPGEVTRLASCDATSGDVRSGCPKPPLVGDWPARVASVDGAEPAAIH